MRLKELRNIGISAHIDSGKTTLTERMLFYAGRIHRMNEVRGSGGGATMDHQPLEGEKGITITAAATQVSWQNTRINIIDTPGHVDFTVEVERSLRVLDGAVMVLCAVAGVQSQSVTVDRQMRRYRVPRLAFVNKMDRVGADAFAVLDQLRSKLNLNAAMAQIPIGSGAGFEGAIDLVEMRAIFNDGEFGEHVRIEDIPAAMLEEARVRREELVESVADGNETLLEALIAGDEISAKQLHQAVRAEVCARRFVPVFVGSAYRNRGVQALLDAVVDYLPSPVDAQPQIATVSGGEGTVEIRPDPQAPMAAMAFKVVEDDHGHLTFLRVYQGTIRKGMAVLNTREQTRSKVGRLVRMHADSKSDIEDAQAGDIVAMLGGSAASGDTLVELGATPIALESIHTPSPVISLAIWGKDSNATEKLSKALVRFSKEDPTFRVSTDHETGQTLISGMGELHLEIYVERIRREYGVTVVVGDPRVSYREAIRRRASFDYTLKKQSGGPGQFARVAGFVEPLSDDSEFEFVDSIRGGVIPPQYISACQSGARDALLEGPLAGYPVLGVRVVVDDGEAHSKDSSEVAFRIAARNAVQAALANAGPGLLEPIMRVEIETPAEFQGGVIGELSRRRGVVTSSETLPEHTRIVGQVPLARMFGYATDLRSTTKGCGEFSMEFDRYAWTPSDVETAIIAREG
ncbi:MAG: elongation factor G [Myxococcota bacterium]